MPAGRTAGQLSAVPNKTRNKRSWFWRAAGIVLLIALGIVLLNERAIIDWYRLRSYQPPHAIVQLADGATMTASARHLFYLNQPQVSTKADFRQHCPDYGEKTIVLGCYLGNQHGIYILGVNDQRLEGVERVTAAHEMLHAAYDRLSKADKTTVNRELQDYADHGLQDGRVKAILKSYQKTEPGQELNEMHSIFGTEVAQLPQVLEQYYSRYFANRQAVTGAAGRYQAAFTSRQEQVAAFDKELATMNNQVQADLKRLETLRTALERSQDQLQAFSDSGNYQAYNAGVEPYNRQVAAYNELLDSTRSQIEIYNQKVEQRNAVAAETAELTRAIDSSVLPKAK